MNIRRIFPVFGTALLVWLFLTGCAGLNSHSGSGLVLEGALPEGSMFYADRDDAGNITFIRSLNRALRLDSLYSEDGVALMVRNAEIQDVKRQAGIAFVSLECRVVLDIDILDKTGALAARVSGSVEISHSRLRAAVESADAQLDIWEEGIMDRAGEKFAQEILY